MFALERQPCSAPKVLNPITRIPIEFDSRRKKNVFSAEVTAHKIIYYWVWLLKSMKALRSVNISCFFFLSLADCVYIESQRPNTPYFICSIQDFKLVSRFLFIVPLPISLFHVLISSHQPIHTCHTRESTLLSRRNSKGNRGKAD